eukprot:tig00001479_g8903.t1
MNALNIASLAVNLFTVYCGRGMLYRTTAPAAASETGVTALAVLFAVAVLFRAVLLLAFKKARDRLLDSRLALRYVYTSHKEGHFAELRR